MSTQQLTQKTFDNFVNSNETVIVDFWAPWCKPCQAMKPIMESLPQIFQGSIAVGMVDIDEEGELAGREEVASLPHFAVYRNGQKISEIQGALPPKKFQEWVAAQIVH